MYCIGLFYISYIITGLIVLTGGPEALVYSSVSVVEGSVIQIYYTVEDNTTFTLIHMDSQWKLSIERSTSHSYIREDNLPELLGIIAHDDSTSCSLWTTSEILMMESISALLLVELLLAMERLSHYTYSKYVNKCVQTKVMYE